MVAVAICRLSIVVTVAAAAFADCLSIGALFCQWVAQKCCSISMHNAAATDPTTATLTSRRGWLV